MEQVDLIARVTEEMKSLADALVSTDYTNACSDAGYELGWSFPITDDFKIFWFKQRVKRHLFFYLLSQSAENYKIKKFSLEQKFDHFKILVKELDLAFDRVIEDRPDMFAGVDAYKMFGTKIDAGFSYDSVGQDTTYTTDNQVIFTPSGD